MAKLPGWLISDLWAHAMEDQDPARQARVIAWLSRQRNTRAKRMGRPPLEYQKWCAIAVAAYLVTRIHEQTQETLVEAAGKVLTWWPHRTLLRPPCVDTLLKYHRIFRRQMMNRSYTQADDERPTSRHEPPINGAASYYSALCSFADDMTVGQVRALLAETTSWNIIGTFGAPRKRILPIILRSSWRASRPGLSSADIRGCARPGGR
jgi:hypothetical protein